MTMDVSVYFLSLHSLCKCTMTAAANIPHTNIDIYLGFSSVTTEFIAAYMSTGGAAA